MPILKSRAGEMSAVAHLARTMAPRVLPIIEVVPSDRHRNDPIGRLLDRMATFPLELRVAVDLRHLVARGDGGSRPMRRLADGLPLLASLLPVLHPHDDPEQLADAGYAAGPSREAIVRLSTDAHHPDDTATPRRLARLREHSGLGVEQCHLIIDASSVTSERDVSRAEPVVRKWASWAARDDWRSVTVAAGAMPESLSWVKPLTPTPVRRWDLDLWRRVRGLGVRYADYAIAHPGLPENRWSPPPSLRYTDGDVWWVYRWPRADGVRAAMRDLCHALVTSEHWPPDDAAFSWGDEQISQRAAGEQGPGNPTSWRAWGTSHHLAHVVAQLTGA